jgi:hypothetical protein
MKFRTSVTLLGSALALFAAVGCGPSGSNPASAQNAGASSGTTSPSQSAGTGTPTTGAPLAQASADPTLTYQAPSGNLNTYGVSNGNGITVSPNSYSVPSGSSLWTDPTTVTWRTVDLPGQSNFTPGSFTDSRGVSRLGYQYQLNGPQTPYWGGYPRVELDSASIADQNAPGGGPVSGGWSSGVLTEGQEIVFTWSTYFSQNLNTSQPWADFFQLHPGNSNYSYNGCNNYPNNKWPQLTVTNGKIAFGLGPDLTFPQVWSDNLSNYLGVWTDFALHIKLSTKSDGLMKFYVNGKLVGTQTGNNMPYCTTNGVPWYYAKQGYYRSAAISTLDTVYQTPVMSTQLH